MRMSCKEFTDFLMDYDTGELDAEVREKFDEHMVDCPPCITYLESYRKTVRLGKECDTESPPPDPPEELIQAILHSRKKR